MYKIAHRARHFTEVLANAKTAVVYSNEATQYFSSILCVNFENNMKSLKLLRFLKFKNLFGFSFCGLKS